MANIATKGSNDNRPMGIVRFMVTPGTAIVECGSEFQFGETPLKDQRMPVGEYKCTFTSTKVDEMATRTVKVEQNKLSKIAVDF